VTSPRARRRLKFASAIAAMMVMGTLALATVGRADDRQAPECLTSTKSVIYRAYGYDHFVRLANTCPSVVRCELSTATLPAQDVTLDPGEHKELLLRRGSPARAFEYSLVCTGGD